ncbi:MAG: hypothetical protein M0Z36_02635 [Thermaerobacter sp.]|nr:hypothetical protein [Thermaerobacter sp.]
MTISEQEIRAACWREHAAIVQCGGAWDGIAPCPEDVASDMAHHTVVLYVLREYLAQTYHRRLHGD